MIEATDLIQKLGKKKVLEMMLHSRPKGKTMGQIEAGIKGRVKYRACGHGIATINDYKPTGEVCGKCFPDAPKNGFYILEDVPEHFNQALGGIVSGRKDMERTAREKGLVHLGDDRL